MPTAGLTDTFLTTVVGRCPDRPYDGNAQENTSSQHFAHSEFRSIQLSKSEISKGLEVPLVAVEGRTIFTRLLSWRGYCEPPYQYRIL